MPTASSLAWKTSLRKVRTLWHCSRLKERGALPMIDRGDIRQAIDRCSNIWASLPGAGYGRSGARPFQPDCKIQRSGRNGQRDWCMSRVTAIISALVICIIVRLLRLSLIITVITPLPTKCPARQMPENEAGERGNYRHADASAWCCCADANTRRS